MAYNQSKRAATEGNQPRTAEEQRAIEADKDCDNINFANYKGIYAEESGSNEKYICPVTGAHFEFNDMSRRMKKIIEKRKPYED
jgi:hypothetical protein